MKKENSIKLVSLTFGVLVLTFAVGFYVFAAWKEPASNPPDPNVPAPINESTNSQYKDGPLGVNGFRNYGSTRIDDLVSCDTIDTDASGNLACGTDEGGAGGSLPSGSSGQTLRHNGTTWIADSNIYNTGMSVGIGTTSPNIYGHVAARKVLTIEGSTGAGIIELSSGTGGDAEFEMQGEYTFVAKDNGGEKRIAMIGAETEGGVAGNWGGVLKFYTRAGGVGKTIDENTPQMIINSAGMVGIGTKSFAVPVHDVTYYAKVAIDQGSGYGPIVLRGDESHDKDIIFQDSTTQEGWILGECAEDPCSNMFEAHYYDVNGVTWAPGFSIQKGDGSKQTAATAPAGAGLVGIGNSDALYNLDVNGAMRLRSFSSGPHSNWTGTTHHLGEIYTDTTGALCFYNGSAWERLNATGSCN